MMNSAKSGNRCSKGIKQLRTKKVGKEKELFFFLLFLLFHQNLDLKYLIPDFIVLEISVQFTLND